MIIKDSYREIIPGSRHVKRLYLSVLFWFLGRAIAAAARVDKEVAGEFAALPDGFRAAISVIPNGPHMIVGKNAKGRVQYLGFQLKDTPLHLALQAKNIEAAMLMFTFAESTTTAAARNRLIVDGDVSLACAFVRILNIVEVYLLPKIIARLAVRRYPQWSFVRKYLGRTRIYFRTILGY
jgi:hypothetical protein